MDQGNVWGLNAALCPSLVPRLAAWGLLLGREAQKAQYGVKSTSGVRKANVFLEKWSLLEKAAIGNRSSSAAHVVVIKARPFLDPEIMQ